MTTLFTLTTSTDRDGSTRLALAGELDLSYAEDLRRYVGLAVGRGAAALVIDLDELVFLDSTGVQALIDCRSAAVSRGVGFRVTQPSGMVRRVLEVTGTLDILTTPARA